MKPSVSIIIATFNSEKTLKKALDSVKNQEFDDWECIIVDGGSKDNTLNIVKEFSDIDSRFRYISEPDRGIYDAFNKGWKMANGIWVLYLGSDDFLFRDGLKKLIEFSTNTDIVYGDCELRFENGRKKIRGNYPLSYIDHCLPACHQSFIMKKRIIEELNGFDLEYKIYGDFDLIQRAYIKKFKFKSIDSIICSFYVGGASTDNLSAQKERYKIMKKNKLCKYPLYRIIIIMSIYILLKIKHKFF